MALATNSKRLKYDTLLFLTLSVFVIFCYFDFKNSHIIQIIEELQVNIYDSEYLYDQAVASVKNVPLPFEEPPTTTGCPAKYPEIGDTEFAGDNWQVFYPLLTSADGVAYLLNAYYDYRKTVREPHVRVVAFSNADLTNATIWCQIWFKVGKRAVRTVQSEASSVAFSNDLKRGGRFSGHLISCPLQLSEAERPFSVSLATQKCQQSSNNVKVQYELPERGIVKDFAVCVKHLSYPFEDISLVLIQFIEANLLFGVDKIYFYMFEVDLNTQRVLTYYQSMGKVEIIPHSIVGGGPNDPLIRQQWLQESPDFEARMSLVEYNDCFYRNMHKYRFITLLDLNEFFVPTLAHTYQEMLGQFDSQHGVSSFYAASKFFIASNDPAPEYMNILKMSNVVTLKYPKTVKRSFFNTSRLLTLNLEGPSECLWKCDDVEIPDPIGQLNHYVLETSSRLYLHTTPNRVIWRFLNSLERSIKEAVSDLKLL